MAIHLNLGVQNLNGSAALHTNKFHQKAPQTKALDPKKCIELTLANLQKSLNDSAAVQKQVP